MECKVLKWRSHLPEKTPHLYQLIQRAMKCTVKIKNICVNIFWNLKWFYLAFGGGFGG
jgi:hypothetical protein